jgi:acetylornithine deacetylase/succinyl-diaminopimelate desuccinylase-like protein
MEGHLQKAGEKMDPIIIAEELIKRKSYDYADEPFEYIKELLESCGAEVQVIESEGIKSIHAEIGEGEPEIGFNGHYDTVPPGKDWTMNPLKPKIDKGKLYGLGATDMKGPLGAMLAAFWELSNMDLPIKIIFQAVGDEEIGGFNGSRVLVEKGLYAKRMVIGEPSRESVENEHKGGLLILAKMHGKSAHASRIFAGRNAIMRMVRALSDISDESSFIKTKVTREETDSSITMNVGSIEGGEAHNVVPSACSVKLDIRYPRLTKVDDIIGYLEDKFDEVVVEYRTQSMYTPPDDELVQKSLELARAYIDDTISIRAGFGACDGRYFTDKNIPTVKMGPCGIDEMGFRVLHQKNEFVPVEDLYKWKEVYKHIALHYANK